MNIMCEGKRESIRTSVVKLAKLAREMMLVNEVDWAKRIKDELVSITTCIQIETDKKRIHEDLEYMMQTLEELADGT